MRGKLAGQALRYIALALRRIALIVMLLASVSPFVASAQTFAEFIATAKANPGKLNTGTPGLGSSSHLTGEMLKLAAGIAMTHVPYGSLAPALTDLLAGHTDVMTANLARDRR